MMTDVTYRTVTKMKLDPKLFSCRIDPVKGRVCLKSGVKFSGEERFWKAYAKAERGQGAP